nr:copia protein [Tanacetum cinerariifolium]
EEGTHTYVLFLVLSDGSTNPKNNKDAHTGGIEHHDDIQKSVSPDFHSSSCGDQAKEQGDKAVNKDKGKSPVVTITGFRDLNKEFTECINNSSNGRLTQITWNPKFQSVLFQQPESTKITQLLRPGVWQEELEIKVEYHRRSMKTFIPFKMQKVWILVDLPYGKRAIGTKWVYRNKKDERGIVIRNKARLVAQGHTQEEGINYEEVFVPVARIKAIRLFLAYASFMGFPVYQMDVSTTIV